MKNKFSKKLAWRLIILFLVISFIVFGYFIFNFQKAEPVKAQTGNNVNGWAWSETIGWISFNCTDREAATGKTCLDANDPSFNPAINLVDYGSGSFEGYAWSETIGWIGYNPSALIGCPVGNCTVHLNLDNMEISGWARACSVFASGCSGALAPNEERGGWDGWIKLRGTAQDSSPFGVWVDRNPSPNEFRDWGWGNDIIGWVSFNCTDRGVCFNSNYKVLINFNLPPWADNLNVSQDDYCFKPSPPVYLNWTFSDPDPGDTQSAYQIEIDDNSSFTSPRGCPLSSDTKVTSAGAGPGYSCVPIGLSFDTSYWWRVKVWDNLDNESEWSSADSFSAEPRYPWPEFKCNGQDCSNVPVEKEKVITFTNLSNYCDPCTYVWDFGDGTPPEITDDVFYQPIHSYPDTGEYIVTLGATDSLSNFCLREHTLKVRMPLPKWKEISPF